MGCCASNTNPPLSKTKMQLISEMPPEARDMCAETFEALDKDGNGSITLEDSIWAKPFLDAYDIDKDGKVTLNEYLFACSRQLAENPGWTPTVALLAHGAKTATNGKYLVLGLKGAGKTTLIKHLKLGELETDAGVDRLAYKGLELISWDLPGKRGDYGYEEELANITGLVYVIDAANQRSFGKAAELLQKLLLNEQCRKAKLMVMANKQDLGDAVQVAELSQALSLTSLRGQQWTIQGSSAMRGDGVFEAFSWLTTQ